MSKAKQLDDSLRHNEVTEMDRWIEVEDTYLTNQPVITEGRGRSRRRVPDPDVEPTEMFLFCYDCKRTKRGVSRKRRLQTLDGKNTDDLDQKLMNFMARNDVMLIEAVDNPRKYIFDRAESDPIPMVGMS